MKLSRAFLVGLLLFATSTDGAEADSDGDGVPDTWESRHGFDAHNAADGRLDFDGDGLDNAHEFKIGTDAAKPDTDGDGMPDGWEVRYGQNAKDPGDGNGDSDRDGFSNLEEYRGGSNPLNHLSRPHQEDPEDPLGTRLNQFNFFRLNVAQRLIGFEPVEWAHNLRVEDRIAQVRGALQQVVPYYINTVENPRGAPIDGWTLSSILTDVHKKPARDWIRGAASIEQVEELIGVEKRLTHLGALGESEPVRPTVPAGEMNVLSDRPTRWYRVSEIPSNWPAGLRPKTYLMFKEKCKCHQATVVGEFRINGQIVVSNLWTESQLDVTPYWRDGTNVLELLPARQKNGHSTKPHISRF